MCKKSVKKVLKVPKVVKVLVQYLHICKKSITFAARFNVCTRERTLRTREHNDTSTRNMT